MAALAALALSLVWVMSPAMATEPTYVSGNVNSCEDLGLSGEGWNLESEEILEGTHTYTMGDWTIDITADAAGNEAMNFDFANADPPVLVIAVKAADGYYLYDYRPDGATEDTGLMTPNTQDNDPEAPQAGLSHFFICFGETASPSESASQSEEQSVSEEQSASATPTPEESVEAGTGTPAQSIPDNAMPFIGGNPLPTLAFGLMLLTSLAGLAFANVKSARNRS
jgi:hypothetical protein